MASSSETMETGSESQSLSSLLRCTLRTFVDAIHDDQLQFHKSRGEIATEIWPILEFMKNVVQHAWIRKSSDTHNLLLILAVASRDQRLRPVFGGYFDSNPNSQDSILACVLDSVVQDCGGADDPKVLDNALRFVSNCVADNNHNRKLALQKGAIKTLLRLAKERRSVDFIIPALYNLCVEYDDPDAMPDAGDATASKANPAQLALAHADTENGAVRALLEMLTGVGVEIADRKPLLAALVEMVSLTAPEDLLCIGVKPEMDSADRFTAIHKAIIWLLGTEAHDLSCHDGDSAVSICTALLNVLTAQEAKEILVSTRFLQRLVDLDHIIGSHAQGLLGDGEEEETLASIQQCRRVLLREFYTLSGLSEFAKSYTVDSDFMQVCIERPRHSKFWSYDPNPRAPSVAIAYTVLANATTSEEVAVKLVHTYRVQEPLQAVVSDLDDADALYPALGFLSRLALPSANKQEIVNSGMLDALRRFLRTPKRENALDWKPAIRIEALTTIRRLISGQIGILTLLNQDSDLGCYWKDILVLFTAYKDASTKIEIGRLFVEHFRTVSSAQDQLAPQSKLYEQMINQNNLADPIAFLAREGTNSGAKAEGWFGLGLMTFWPQSRAQVLKVMQTSTMLEEVGKVTETVRSSERASADNLKLVLSRLDLDQSTTDIDRHAREVFTSAKQKLGLDT